MIASYFCRYKQANIMKIWAGKDWATRSFEYNHLSIFFLWASKKYLIIFKGIQLQFTGQIRKLQMSICISRSYRHITNITWLYFVLSCWLLYYDKKKKINKWTVDFYYSEFSESVANWAFYSPHIATFQKFVAHLWAIEFD